MKYSKFLKHINRISVGSAIITLQGKRLCHKGIWKARLKDEIDYSNIYQNPKKYIGARIKYDKKEFIINPVGIGVVIAQFEKEGLIFQNYKSFIICAHYVEGQVANNISVQMYFAARKIENKIKANNQLLKEAKVRVKRTYFEEDDILRVEQRRLEVEENIRDEKQSSEEEKIKQEMKLKHTSKASQSICASCKKEVEKNDCIYYSGNPYHYGCVKCFKCNKTFNINEKADNYVWIISGLFLCREHYNESQNSNHLDQAIIKEYQEKKKENFVEEVFNQPWVSSEDTKNYPQEEMFVTPEMENDSVQKKPYEDFIPTVKLHFDKQPQDIDYDQLKKLLGDDVVILDVAKGSTIIKIALLSIDDFDLGIDKQYEKFVTDFKEKLDSSMGKAVVGNLVDEPVINYPSDDQINTAYNKNSISLLQHTQELNALEINEIKKKILQNLKKDQSSYNWKFIFQHEDLYDKLEEQLKIDIENSPFEMIIVGQTIIADQFIDEYEKIKNEIPFDDVKEQYLYHGSPLKNHLKIVKQHFVNSEQDKNIKPLDEGFYGRGIYATDNIFYALMYSNGFNVLNYDQCTNVLCCKAIYNKSKIKKLVDLSYNGKQIDDDIKNNYGINQAFVGDSKSFLPISFYEKYNCKISGYEFVFPNRYQLIPFCSFKVMRKDHYILWKDEDIENKEKSCYLKQLSKDLEVNIYGKNNNEDAYTILRNKKHVKVKLISNDSNGKEFIEKARNYVKSNFITLVFTNSTDHMSWISEMENVLLTTDSNDLKKFAALKLNMNDVLLFVNELKKKYETSQYKFNINESELLNYPERLFGDSCKQLTNLLIDIFQK